MLIVGHLKAISTLLVGALLSLAGLLTLRLETESYRWPITRGRVQSAEVESEVVLDSSSVTSGGRQVKYLPRITYVYAVRGITYTNQRYSLEERYGSAHSAQAIVRNHPPQKEVTVYYRSRAPAESVLVPGGGYRAWMMTAGGLGLLGYGAIQWWRTSHQQRSGHDGVTHC